MAKETVGVEVDVQIDGAKTLQTLKKDLKEAQGQALALSRQFGETSKEAQAAAKRVAMLKDEVADVNERVGLMDPGAKFKAFGNAVTSVTAGFSAAQGAMALFGSESQDLQKQLVKLQGAMALSQGLSTITDSWKDFQRLGAVIKTNVVSAFTTLKGAIAATGIGALIVGIGLIVTNFEAIEKWLKKIIPGFDGFAASFNKVKAVAMGVLGGIIESFKVIGQLLVDVFTGDFSGAIDTAKTAGSRIGAAYNEGFQEEIKDQADEVARAVIQSQIENDKVRLRLLKAGGEARAKEAEAAEKEIARKTIDAQKAGSKEQIEAIVAFAELIEKQKTEAAKKAEEANKKAAEERKAAGQKALDELIKEQELEYRRAVISGRDVYNLKQQQLAAQLAIYKKYGIQLDTLQKQQSTEELDRREKLNVALSKKLYSTTGVVSSELINVKKHWDNFNTTTAESAAVAANAVDEAERRKIDAVLATNELLTGLVSEKQQLSDIEIGAVIAVALATELAEMQKMDAMQATQSGLKIAAKALGEATALGKGVAIATTAIDTIKAASSVFTGMVSTFPGPWGIALGIAGAAAAAIAGFARVKQITAVKIPGATGGGAPATSMPTAPAMPRVQPNTGVMVDQLQQVNTNLNNPQRVVVVESDITNTQDRVASIEENAKF